MAAENSKNLKINTRIADYQKNWDALSQIRRTVFIEEQNVPADLEWDEYDEVSTHFLVYLEDRAVATARLKPDGQVGRMAVLPGFRNQGIGNELLTFVLKIAARKQIKDIYLHAQVTAIPFYEKQGFIAHGETFYEAGITHRIMYQKI